VATALEKLKTRLASQWKTKLKDELLEPQILVISVSLGVLLEGFVCDEDIVGAEEITE